MSFYGKITEPDPPRPLRQFVYRASKHGDDHVVHAHDIYFYESGHVGFWNDISGDERVLVLATPASSVREYQEAANGPE
jgi:hypothetical protein